MGSHVDRLEAATEKWNIFLFLMLGKTAASPWDKISHMFTWSSCVREHKPLESQSVGCRVTGEQSKDWKFPSVPWPTDVEMKAPKKLLLRRKN